jgi:hypothetical protein
MNLPETKLIKFSLQTLELASKDEHRNLPAKRKEKC